MHVGMPAWVALCCVGLLVWVPWGCGGDDDFGESVSLPQSRRHSFSGTLSAGGVLRFPADRPFNVTDTQRRSEGWATARSAAASSGVASCAVDASGGGSGSAEFQIGQVVSHDGAEPFDATVTVSVAYECALQDYTAQLGTPPVSLKVYVMDSDRRTLARIMLVEYDPERVPDRWSGMQSPSFDIRIEPGTAYHFIVAGRVSVSGDDASGPVASLAVQSVEISIGPASR